MTDEQTMAIRAAIQKAEKAVSAAFAEVKQVEALAKAGGDPSRYVVYDMEDAAYALRRLCSDLNESGAEFERILDADAGLLDRE